MKTGINLKSKTSWNKILFVFNLVVLSTFGSFMLIGGCGEPTPSETSETITNTCEPCEGEGPYGRLRANKVFGLISNYRKNHWAGINSLSGSYFKGTAVDSRSVWFDIDRIKSFIREIEKNVDLKKANCISHCEAKLGIRIYFGEYGNTSDPERRAPAPSANYVGMHTLLMVPTFQDPHKIGTAEENVDFDPVEFSMCDPRIPLDTNMAEFLALLPDVSAMNLGTLIPPPDPVSGQCTGARVMHLADYIDAFRTSVCR